MSNKLKMKRKKRRVGFFGVTARLLMLVAASLLALSYLSIVVNPASLWFFSLFGILFLPLFVFNVFLLVWAVVRRSGSFWIPLLALLPSAFLFNQYVGFHGASRQESEWKILSYNLGRFEFARNDSLSSDDRMTAVFAKIKAENPDVICLQEFCVPTDRDIRAICKRHFPRYECAYFAFPGIRKKVGNVTLSRYPVLSRSSQTFEGSTNLVLYTDIDFAGRQLRVCNCHLQSYSISLPGLIKSVDDEDYLRRTGEKMKRSITRRPVQVDEILKNIDLCPLESIVCGDFNDTPASHTYFALRKGHRDSFVEAGRGFGATYYYMWPLLRIDYLLHGNSLQAIRHVSPHWRWSDHYPVIVDFVWNKQ